MGLTLGLLASVLVLLPGLALLAAFNYRTRRGGARRPELPLTAASALALTVVFSLIIHGAAFLAAQGAIEFAIAVNERWPAFDLGQVAGNPLEAFFTAMAEQQPMSFRTGLALALVLVFEAFSVAAFVASDGFDLAFERIDFNDQGWVFEHITRPAENGYTPVGHVYSSATSGAYGIAYKGPIVDIRQGEKGEILSISLARPERFLYEVGSFSEDSSVLTGEAIPSGLKHHEEDYVGGIVNLDARAINNIVVHSIADELLEQIESSASDSENEAAA